MHIQRIKLREFENNKNATGTANKISNVYSQDVMTDRQVRNWFSKIFFLRYLIERWKHQDPDQTLMKKLLENFWNAIRAKILEN